MTIDGEKSPAFSAVSLDLPGHGEDFSPVIIDNSRANYALQRSAVEDYINTRYHLKPQLEPARSHKQPPLAENTRTRSAAKPVQIPAEVQSSTQSKPAEEPQTAAKQPAGKGGLHRAAASGMGRAALVASTVELVKAKRKRRRNRTRKKSTEPANEPVNMLEADKEFVIFSKKDS